MSDDNLGVPKIEVIESAVDRLLASTLVMFVLAFAAGALIVLIWRIS